MGVTMNEPATGRPLRSDARRNRIAVLNAAQEVFAEHGPSASVEEIARHAGVGVGTVYRHFPGKKALFEAIIVDRYERLAAEADALGSADDAGAAFFGLFTRMVEESATKKAFAEMLARAGVDVEATTSDVGQRLRQRFGTLLARAQELGAVRDDVGVDDVVAVLAGMCLAAERTNWTASTKARALCVAIDGLRHRPAPDERP